MVRNSEDETHLVAESLSQALRFLTLQSLTKSTYDFERKLNYEKIIKSKS